MRTLSAPALLALSALLSAPTFAAFNYAPDLTWRTLHTDHFNIHFHDGEDELAREVAARAEVIHAQLSVVIDWKPLRPTEVVLTDRMDFSNGESMPFPNNQMTLIVTPPDELNSLEEYDDWLNLLITHEYTHILHLDKARGAPNNLRGIFGRFFPWLFPNLLAPPWTVEGLATYYETNLDHHIGRGQSSAYEMLMRNEVANGIKPLRQANQPLVTWPAGTTRYLYGVYFFKFLEEKYGRDAPQRWVENYSADLIPFMIDNTSRATFGTPINQLWDEFEKYLRQRFEPQLAQIRARGLRAGTALTHDGYFTGHARVTPNNDVYYLRSDFTGEPQLMVRRHNQTTAEVIAPLRSNRFDVHPSAGILAAQLEIANNTDIFSDLYRVDPESHAVTRLTHQQRYLHAAWSPDGHRIVAVHNERGINSLHLLNSGGTFLGELWRGSRNDVIGELVWSPDGTLLVAPVWRSGEGWNLERFDLAERRWSTLVRSTQTEAQPTFSADGHTIVFTSDHGGVYNIRRLNIDTGTIDTLTNVDTGAFYPALSADNHILYYTALAGSGFDVFQLALDEPPLPTPDATRPATPPLAPIEPVTTATTTDYSPFSTLTPKWWAPYFLFTKNQSEIGAVTSGSDALNRHNFLLMAAYDTENHWATGLANYIYDRWDAALKFSASRTTLEYLNRDNELIRFRHSETVLAEAVWPFLSMNEQWSVHTGIVYEREHDAHVQAAYAPQPSLTDAVAGVALTYNSAKRYPISVSLGNGRQVIATAEHGEVLRSNYSGIVYAGDWREFIALGKQQVLSVRIAAGQGSPGAKPFRLGGDYSEGIADPLELPADGLIHKRRYSLRGYPSGAPGLRGHQMLLGSVEYRFPIQRVEYGYTTPPVGVHQWHGAVFLDSGNAWDTQAPHGTYKRGAGFELNTETVLGYWLMFNVRLGYAHGFDDGGEDQVYFTVGSSF